MNGTERDFILKICFINIYRFTDEYKNI